MKLLKDSQYVQLLKNGRLENVANELPVVKLFSSDTGCTWLLAAIDPMDEDRAL